MTNNELKSAMESLSIKELEELGYVRKDQFDKVTKSLIEISSGILDIIMEWATSVVSEAEKSKNGYVMLFAKTHLTSLKNAVFQKISELKDK